MTEYWFYLKGEWDYGPETVSFQKASLPTDKQARAYAIGMIKAKEKKIPARAYVEIRKMPTIFNPIYVGDVTTYRHVGGRRTYGYITYGMLNKGIYDPRPLNQDGSFRGPAKKKTKKSRNNDYGIKGDWRPFEGM